MRFREIVFAIILALILAPGAVAKSNKPTLKLYGEIDELSYLSSSAGVRLTSSKLPAAVSKISLGSAAAYSGLRDGDKVLAVKTVDNNLVFSIERDGKRYEANVATDVYGLKAEFEARKVPWSFNEGAFDKELQSLTTCELVIMIDRSASMGDNQAGVPGDQTKWSWCKQQIDNFYFSTAKILEGGLDIVTFGGNTPQQRWKSVSLWDLKQVFTRLKPEGKRKDISTPIAEVLNDYFKARKPDSKNLIVVVLTDGLKNEGQPLQTMLAEVSSKIKHPHEVTVVFMQIGDSVFADELFDDLDRNLIAKGARYDFVDYKPFALLRNKGILWELLVTLRDVQRGTASAKRP